MEQFNANPIRSGVGLTVTPPQTASRSITPTESHKPDPQNLIYIPIWPLGFAYNVRQKGEIQTTIWPRSFLPLVLHVNELIARQPCPRIRALTSKNGKYPQTLCYLFTPNVHLQLSDNMSKPVLGI